MKAFFTIILSIVLSQSFGQTGKLYKGTINHSIKVSLYLQNLGEGTNADRVLGIYQYQGQSSYILLNGYRNDKCNLVLVEQAGPNFSGVFLGTLTKSAFNGKWLSADDKKNYPVELLEAPLSKEQDDMFRHAIEERAKAFRAY
jgi:hypothetical protein